MFNFSHWSIICIWRRDTRVGWLSYFGFCTYAIKIFCFQIFSVSFDSLLLILNPLVGCNISRYVTLSVFQHIYFELNLNCARVTVLLHKKIQETMTEENAFHSIWVYLSILEKTSINCRLNLSDGLSFKVCQFL